MCNWTHGLSITVLQTGRIKRLGREILKAAKIRVQSEPQDCLLSLWLWALHFLHTKVVQAYWLSYTSWFSSLKSTSSPLEHETHCFNQRRQVIFSQGNGIKSRPSRFLQHQWERDLEFRIQITLSNMVTTKPYMSTEHWKCSWLELRNPAHVKHTLDFEDVEQAKLRVQIIPFICLY